MNKLEKTLLKILSGSSDEDISFSELYSMLKYLGFEERIKGSHHIFFKDGIEEILNIQLKKSKAKPYQVKQVRNIILKYRIRGE
ncbi:MAG: toxin HicA [Candidatus Hydromicrobium americanum]|nr:MAG: toxin HicA [Candidatus Hydromicrobium americanum]